MNMCGKITTVMYGLPVDELSEASLYPVSQKRNRNSTLALNFAKC